MARSPKTAFGHLLGKCFGTALVEFRNAENISQQRLATESEVDRKYLYQLEKGSSLPTLEIQFRLAGGLGVETSEIVARAGTLIDAASSPKRPRPVFKPAEFTLGEDTCPGCKTTYTVRARRLSARGLHCVVMISLTVTASVPSVAT